MGDTSMWTQTKKKCVQDETKHYNHCKECNQINASQKSKCQ